MTQLVDYLKQHLPTYTPSREQLSSGRERDERIQIITIADREGELSDKIERILDGKSQDRRGTIFFSPSKRGPILCMYCRPDSVLKQLDDAGVEYQKLSLAQVRQRMYPFAQRKDPQAAENYLDGQLARWMWQMLAKRPEQKDAS